MPAKPITTIGPGSPAPAADAPEGTAPQETAAAVTSPPPPDAAAAAEADAAQRIEAARLAVEQAEAEAAARIEAARSGSIIIPFPAPDTTRTRNKGKYWQHAGLGMEGVTVDVLKRYTVKGHDDDGVPYSREVVDLAYPGRDTPFVRQCPVTDKPQDGHFVPA